MVQAPISTSYILFFSSLSKHFSEANPIRRKIGLQMQRGIAADYAKDHQPEEGKGGQSLAAGNTTWLKKNCRKHLKNSLMHCTL